MAFKTLDTVLLPDPRFVGLCVVENGTARQMTLGDHHAGLADIQLNSTVPVEVSAAFDRARNTVVYAFFDYDLFVVGEVQAFGALELALKFRMNGHGGSARGTLRNLVDRARKAGVLPPTAAGNMPLIDPIEALVTTYRLDRLARRILPPNPNHCLHNQHPASDRLAEPNGRA